MCSSMTDLATVPPLATVSETAFSAWCSSGRDRAVVAALVQRYMEGIIYL